MDREKINIYVSSDIKKQIYNDAEMFEIFKSNGKDINMNLFIRKLIKGYYYRYIEEHNEVCNKIMNVLEDTDLSDKKRAEISNRIYNELLANKNIEQKGKKGCSISFKPTQDTEAILSAIERTSSDTLGVYLKDMIISYCNHPFSIREQIIFKDQYEMLLNACKNRTSISFCTIWNKNVQTVIPYKLAIAEEEMYNYLVCVRINNETNTQQPASYRLNRIDSIITTTDVSIIDRDILSYLDRMIEYGPQYVINSNEECCIKLSDRGKKAYRRIYYGRPKIDRIEGDCYYFKCSMDQLYLYFRRFNGEQIEAIYPESLRNRIIEFHKSALTGIEVL